MNNPSCPDCGHRFGWMASLARILGRARQGTALWGLVCPHCQADLKVPNGRMLLIVTSGIFFGSQSSTLFLGGGYSLVEFWLIKILLVLGFYGIAIFFFLTLERVDPE